MLQDLMDVDALLLGHAVRPEHSVHQLLQPVRLVDDDPGVFAQRLVRKLLFQKLGRPAQAAKGILDLVGEPPDQRLGGLVLRNQLLFAGDAQLTIHLPQLDQRLGGRIEIVQRQTRYSSP